MANARPVRMGNTTPVAEPNRNPTVASEDELLKTPEERVGAERWAELVELWADRAIYKLPGGSYVPGTKMIREDL